MKVIRKEEKAGNGAQVFDASKLEASDTYCPRKKTVALSRLLRTPQRCRRLELRIFCAGQYYISKDLKETNGITRKVCKRGQYKNAAIR